MKIKQLTNIVLVAAVMVPVLLDLSSCQKYNSLGFTPGTGAPAITAVHTYSKTDTANITTMIMTIDSTGKDSSAEKVRSGQPQPFDSLTNAGNLGNYYLIEGTNLGSATSVTFNGATAYFNRAMITDHSILVQIPSKTPYYGPQATDSLVVTTLHGSAYYKFSIIPPPPTISDVSDYDFWEGSQISLTGVGFASVTSVGLTGTTATCTVVSQNDTVLVLQFPAITVNRANLVFTYSAGTVTSTQEFVDVDNAYQIFAKNNFQNGWYDNSWTKASPDISTSVAKTGTATFVMVFPAGSWQVEGFANYSPGAVYAADYKYLSFWIKGGTVDHTLNINSDQALGWGQNSINPIDVPPAVWTYYKIPLSTLGLNNWTASQPLTSLAFFLKGQSGDVNETYYLDDVILVK